MRWAEVFVMVEDRSLIVFSNPPVQETAMSVEFQPMPALSASRLVEVRNSWSPPYDHQEDHPALPAIPLEGDMPFIQFGPGVPPVSLRLWGEDRASGRLLQIQQDRLILNWRRLSPDLTYPGYPTLLEEFASRWQGLVTALGVAGLPVPRPTTAEYTYVNVIQATGDTDLTRALETLVPEPRHMPGRDAGVFYRTQRRLLQDEGAAGIVVVTANREPDVPHWNLTITTKVQAVASDPVASLDIAHSASRNTFLAVTTGDAQSAWGVG
jgi:uncharacterized protein (TIGR04255 family)